MLQARLCWYWLIGIMLLAACSGGNYDYTFTSLEQSFEIACKERLDINEELLQQMFPNFGEERLVHVYPDAKAIVHRCDSVRALIDSFKKRLAERKVDDAVTGAFARSLKEILHPALLEYIVAHATYDSADSVKLNDDIVAKKYDAFENTAEWPEVHFAGSTAKMQMELSRIKYDIVDAEKLALSQLYSSSRSHCGMRFDPYMGAAIPQQSFLFEGDRFEASLFFLYRPDTPAFKVREMEMNGQKIDVTDEVGHYREIARGPGLHSLRGKVAVVGPDGDPIIKEVKVEYMVMKPISLIETESLRTIFGGQHNTLRINVWGFMQKDMIVQADKGTLTGASDGKYDLYVADTGIVRLMISAKLQSGTIIPIDTQFLHAIIHK